MKDSGLDNLGQRSWFDINKGLKPAVYQNAGGAEWKQKAEAADWLCGTCVTWEKESKIRTHVGCVQLAYVGLGYVS